MPQNTYPPPELPLTTIPTPQALHNTQTGLPGIPSPLNHTASHSSSTIHQSHPPLSPENEKKPQATSLYGRRRAHTQQDDTPQPESRIHLTKIGAFYAKILTFGTGTRYSIYILPVAILLAIPIIVSATAVSRTDPTIGGVRLVWFFTWLESVWLSLWVSIFVSRLLPTVFRYAVGVISPKTKKYARVLENLKACVAVLLWVVQSFVLYEVLFSTASAGNRPGGWTATFKQVLGAILVATIIFCVKKFFVQIISVSYHARSFNYRIVEAKRAVRLLSGLFEASRQLFPMYGEDFWEEDEAIRPGFESYVRKGRFGHNRFSKEQDPKEVKKRKVLRGLGTLGEKVHSVFGNIASELTGKSTLLPERSAQRFVLEALEKTKSSKALARRLWLSFVMEGNDVLRLSDLEDVLGQDEHEMAKESFGLVDPDGNDDVKLDEMVLKVTELCNERNAIARSMHDVSQAIKALDATLGSVALLISVFVLVCFLDTGFSAILTTASTTLLSLSFVFSVTAQEFLGSCIFLFVKHPYDINDRVNIPGPDGINQLEVEQISLLYTSFKRITDLELIQIPNNVLNTLWINNVTRAKALLERIDMYISFDTSMEDIEALRAELEAFVSHEDNKREFQPGVVLRVIGVGSMDKLQLQLQVRHKSNWFIEHIRATRKSKLMCALVLAMRKIPINPPGGGGKPLGDPLNPTYSVAISDAQAMETRRTLAETRLHPVGGKRRVSQSIEDSTLSPITTENHEGVLGDSQGTTTTTATAISNTSDAGLRYRGKAAGNEHEALASIPEKETMAADALNAMNLSEDLLRVDENDKVGIVREPALEISITKEVRPSAGVVGGGNLALKKSASVQGKRKPGITVSSRSSNPGENLPLENVHPNGSHPSRAEGGGHFDLEAQVRV